MPTLIIRLIRSFTYRTIKYLILHNIPLSISVHNLQSRILQEIHENPIYESYRSIPFDTLKIYAHPQATKTANRVINLDHEEWILINPNETLESAGIEHETEISFFYRQDYEKFKTNPEEKW